MSDRLLESIRELIQEDVCGRGLATDPVDNLLTSCREDFATACRSLAETRDLAVGIVTGFLIVHVQPPRAETDGPLGALFLARALAGIGARVQLITEEFCAAALAAGLAACNLEAAVPLIVLPAQISSSVSAQDYCRDFGNRAGQLTHLIAIERVGPSHTAESVHDQPGATDRVMEEFTKEVSPERRDRCYTMRGLDITSHLSPAHLLFESEDRKWTTIGIGDGGNEIGMGKIPWSTVRRNIPGGGLIACRVPTDHLVVAGISNWGAYGLAAGVRALRGLPPDPELFDPSREKNLLQQMIQFGPLVDGVTGEATLSVDGLDFDSYVAPLWRLGSMSH
jgi:hypothetical protein